MVLRLERLPLNIPIADKNGKPQTAFSRWWDQALTQIEENLNGVIAAQEAADAAQGTADAAQAAAVAAQAAADTAQAAAIVAQAAADAAQTAATSAQTTANAAKATADALDASLDVTTGKVLTVLNTLTLRGIDGSTLDIGTGGTLGSAAFTPSTNYLARASNLSDVANVATARTNLGVSATGADTNYPLKSNNLSDLSSIATARTNLGVTATGADTAYAFRANNLSDLASIGTALVNLGLKNGSGAMTLTTSVAQPIVFTTNGTERARFIDTGYFKASNTGSYYSITAPFHEFSNNVAGGYATATFQHTHATDAYGLNVFLINAAPNNATNYFMRCLDSSGNKCVVYSNGGIHNYSANNVNLSDADLKTDIAPYTDEDLDRLEECFVTVDWGRFKYTDQTHSDPNHGYTAQGVEMAFAGVAPELVDDTELGPAGDGKRKAVYDSDLTHIGMALLARGLRRISALDARLTAAGV